VSASGDQTVRVWDVGSGKELKKLEGHTCWVYSASFSADSKLIVSASSDMTVRVWDVGSGKELKKLEGHTTWVRSASFSADSKLIVSASWDKTVRVWDVGSGKELKKLEGHTEHVDSASFSAATLSLTTLLTEYHPFDKMNVVTLALTNRADVVTAELVMGLIDLKWKDFCDSADAEKNPKQRGLAVDVAARGYGEVLQRLRADPQCKVPGALRVLLNKGHCDEFTRIVQAPDFSKPEYGCRESGCHTLLDSVAENNCHQGLTQACLLLRGNFALYFGGQLGNDDTQDHRRYLMNSKSCGEGVYGKENWLPDTLVLEGGGPKGMSYFTALTEHNKSSGGGALSSVSMCAGASAGAIACTAISCGYTVDEAKEILLKRMGPVEILELCKYAEDAEKEANEKSALTKLGDWVLSVLPVAASQIFSSASKIRQATTIGAKALYDIGAFGALNPNGDLARGIFEEMTQHATKIKNCTFGEFGKAVERNAKLKHLVVTTTLIRDSFSVQRVFSTKDCDRVLQPDPIERLDLCDYVIADVVRASMGLPLVFGPTELRRKDKDGDVFLDPRRLRYIDGGLKNNFPYDAVHNMFPMRRHTTLGFLLKTKDQLKGILSPMKPKFDQVESTFGLFDTLNTLVGAFYENQHEKYTKEILHDYVVIDPGTVTAYSFNLNEAEKEALEAAGAQGYKDWKARVEKGPARDEL